MPTPKKTPAPPRKIGGAPAALQQALDAVAALIPPMAAEWTPAEPLALDAPDGAHRAAGWEISVEAGRVVYARRAAD